MRRKKVKEQLISIIALSSVFVFFVYLKMNPEVSSTSLSSEVVELEKEVVLAVQNDEQYIEDDESVTNAQELESSESIIEYTESELNRAKAYLNRGWKPDHTINSVAWEYVSRIEIEKDETGKNQVVNAIK